eukprot:jgi/Mesen1/6591/ME000338S05766
MVTNVSRGPSSLLLRTLLKAIIQPYLQRNPTAGVAMDLLQRQQQHEGPLCYDHLAFRTFDADGCGIASLSQIFMDLGYTRRDELRFPAKKLRAFWFAPPPSPPPTGEADSAAAPAGGAGGGGALDGPLPRIFISELLVEELSQECQAVVREYTGSAGAGAARHAGVSSVVGALPWPVPSLSHYQLLARESEYAAWTLANGYSLNHVALSVHRLHSPPLRDIRALNALLQGSGLKLNPEGGILKVSPDGGLLQSSTMADLGVYEFAAGEKAQVPRSYIEFAQRLVLPQFRHLPPDQVQEDHRRDGFEVGNADKIFESTYAAPGHGGQ